MRELQRKEGFEKIQPAIELQKTMALKKPNLGQTSQQEFVIIKVDNGPPSNLQNDLIPSKEQLEAAKKREIEQNQLAERVQMQETAIRETRAKIELANRQLMQEDEKNRIIERELDSLRRELQILKLAEKPAMEPAENLRPIAPPQPKVPNSSSLA